MGIFSLSNVLSGPVEKGPSPDVVRLRINGRKVLVAEGDKVLRGQRVAESMQPGIGDMHSPLVGEVRRVGRTHVTVDVLEGDGVVDRAHIDTSSPESLRGQLKEMGFSSSGLRRADHLVINGVGQEPGVTVPQQLLKDKKEVLFDGLKIVRALVNPSRVTLAVADGIDLTFGDAAVHRVRPVYPGSLDPLVMKSVTGKETPQDAVVLDIDRLYEAGRILRDGRPLAERIVSVFGRNMRVILGTTLGALCEHAQVELQEGDRLIDGGIFRGQPQFALDAPVRKRTYALTRLPRGSMAAYGDGACVNCGECTLHCPARIPVAIMNRFAEFQLFEKARQYDIDSCFECGLCAYWCPAHRPLLQYIRMAKTQLGKINGGECLLVPEEMAAGTPSHCA